jgi:RHS repeat-associated protein
MTEIYEYDDPFRLDIFLLSKCCKFTAKERDSETGNDNFKARYYGSSLGRFMTPDPLGNFVADPTNPQSWNMYS